MVTKTKTAVNMDSNSFSFLLGLLNDIFINSIRKGLEVGSPYRA